MKEYELKVEFYKKIKLSFKLKGPWVLDIKSAGKFPGRRILKLVRSDWASTMCQVLYYS